MTTKKILANISMGLAIACLLVAGADISHDITTQLIISTAAACLFPVFMYTTAALLTKKEAAMKCRKCGKWMKLLGLPIMAMKKVTYIYRCKCGFKSTLQGRR